MLRTLRASRTILVALGLAAALGAGSAEAVGPRSFVLSTLDDLKGGAMEGVSVDSSGSVRAGLTLGTIPLPDVTSLWSGLVMPDGTALLGTGAEGKVLAVRGGAVSVAATTAQLAASALAIAWDGDVAIGTFPGGKLFRAGKGALTGGEAKLVVALPDAESIWALAYDAKARALYAGTGPEGKVFRIDAAGKADVYFDSEEPHIVALALAEDGALYAGSDGKAQLFKLTGPGRATVVHDFEGDDVKAIAIAPKAKGGAVYVLSNSYGDAGLSSKKSKQPAAGPQASKPAKPGKGKLHRIGPDGVAEQLIDDDKTHFTALALDDAGRPFVGTGAEGQVYSVDDDHVVQLVADTAERQVGALVMAGARRFVATSDPAIFHELRGLGGADAVWTSKVLDAGLRAQFGRVTFRSDGAVELSTRTGNTEAPDASWSPWSADSAQAFDVTSPPGRFVQVRARFRRDPAAILREVTLSFVTDNARAIVTSVDGAPKGSPKPALKPGLVASGGEAPKPSSTLKLTWKVDNPDQDELRYRLSYRLEGQAVWNDLLQPGEVVTKTEYEWDTTTLPEGVYRVRVEASDERANPPDRVKLHGRDSSAILVDNTPPLLRNLRVAGKRLSGEASDGLGPIVRIEVALAGSDDFRPLFSSDGVLDEPSEAFDADVSRLVPPRPTLLVVRAYDAAGNAVSANVPSQ